MMDRDVAILIKKVCEKKEIRKFKVCNEDEKDKYLDFFEALDIHWRQGEKPRGFTTSALYLYPFAFGLDKEDDALSFYETSFTDVISEATSWDDLLKLVVEG